VIWIHDSHYNGKWCLFAARQIIITIQVVRGAASGKGRQQDATEHMPSICRRAHHVVKACLESNCLGQHGLAATTPIRFAERCVRPVVHQLCFSSTSTG
jgi:hypothetical protein